LGNLASCLLAVRTSAGNTYTVILVVPDAALAQLAASPVLLAQTWPAACEEVMMLIHLLRMSVPSLAEVLAMGLIAVLAPAAGMISAQISLTYRTAVLTADATGENGEHISAPHLRAADVRRLVVTDLSAGGRSALRLAG
jgi:hypothetical protein